MFKSKESTVVTNLKNDISALQQQLEQARAENSCLKKECDMLRNTLTDKQVFILKTKKLLEDTLKRKNAPDSVEKIQILLTNYSEEANKKIPEGLRSETPKTDDSENISEDSQTEEELLQSLTPHDGPIQKRKKLIYPPKPRDFSTLGREIFTFELELKEYNRDLFEDIKVFVAKTNITSTMLDEKIEELAEKLENVSYFKSIFPQRTKERCAECLENYLFEILYSKVYKPNEDAKAFAQQLKERLFVLRSIVTFEMLDISPEIQNMVMFENAAKEFERLGKLRSPLLKLEAIQNCANILIEGYLDVFEKQPDANELFPMLSYVILISEVEHLKLQADFIVNFLRKELSFGQLGFLAVNLKAILQFLNDVDGSVLIKEGKLSIRRLTQETPY